MPPTFTKRATSPLHFEPLRPPPEDILCYGSDDEETPEGHRDKRRRIEAQGQQYLRRGRLFILSASLRGPLDEGWVNPWARRKRGRKGLEIGTIPKEPRVMIEDSTRKTDIAVRQPVLKQLPVYSAADTISPGILTLESKPQVKRLARLNKQDSVSADVSRPGQGSIAFPLTLNEYESWNERGLAPGTKTSRGPQQNWLKSENIVFEKRAQRLSRHSTPTPISKPPDQVLPIFWTPVDHTSGLSPPHPTTNVTIETLLKNTSNFGFTPVNERQTEKDQEALVTNGNSKARRNSPPKKTVHKTKIPTTAQTIQERNCRAKRLSEEAAEQTKAKDEAGRPTHQAVSGALDRSSSIDTPSTLPHESNNALCHVRRLSFTASGNVKDSKFKPRKLTRKKVSSCGSSPEGLSCGTLPPSLGVSTSGEPSRDVNEQPEAQIVIADPIGAGLLLSGPSTNLLETDKQPPNFASIEEGDSYANLSTQAAILKAQRYFQNDVISPLKSSSQGQQIQEAVSEVSPTAKKATKPISTPRPASQGLSAYAKSLTPGKNEAELMSTQAMVEAMSPFAITTVKKQKRTSFALSSTSPTAAPFPPHSFSMATTPTHTPPAAFTQRSIPAPANLSRTNSNLLSPSLPVTLSSIAPIGSLAADAYQHDGQQQQPPPSRYFDASGWDLDVAIEEAEQFLGSWDVETEARKEGRMASGRGVDAHQDSGVGREERTKGMLSG